MVAFSLFWLNYLVLQSENGQNGWLVRLESDSSVYWPRGSVSLKKRKYNKKSWFIFSRLSVKTFCKWDIHNNPSKIINFYLKESLVSGASRSWSVNSNFWRLPAFKLRPPISGSVQNKLRSYTKCWCCLPRK